MVKSKKVLTFEEALEKLETITAELESGNLSLDESVAAFQEGIQLSLFCQQELEKAEGSVKQLIKNAQGELTLTDFVAE